MRKESFLNNYAIVVLICICLMASDAEHLFICLWALCISCLDKCLFKSLGHFLIGLLVFLEWNHVTSLHILEIKPLSEVSLANTFSHTVDSLFILLMFSLVVKKIYFDEVPFVYSFLYVPCSRGNIVENIAAWDICMGYFPPYVLL